MRYVNYPIIRVEWYVRTTRANKTHSKQGGERERETEGQIERQRFNQLLT